MTLRAAVGGWCVGAGMVIAAAANAFAQVPESGPVAERVSRARVVELAELAEQYRAAVDAGRVTRLAQGRGARTGGPALPAASLPTDPMTGPVVTNAPYSGDAVTTVTQTLGDGTRIEQRAEAKFYRDGAGRVRSEQTIIGLGALDPAAQGQTVITIDPTPGDAFAYTLDPNARTARRVVRGGSYFGVGFNWTRNPSPDMERELERLVNTVRGGSTSVSVAAGLAVTQLGTPRGATRTDESLGTRQIEGVKANGRKTTSVIPAGQIGNDRPIEITDERWESPELRLMIYSRYSDPRTGVVEYKLMNINRAEPPPALFLVPPEYTVIEPGAGTPGLRIGGAGGRGQPQ